MKGDLKRDFKHLENVMGIGAFIEGSIGIILPLYLFSLGISLEEVGLILAISPFIYGASRVIASIFSDIEGVKHFIIMESFYYALVPITIFLFPDVLGVSLAMTFQGIARANTWAVARPAALKFRRRKDSTSKVVGVRYFGLGMGRLISPILSYIVGYVYSFLIIGVIGVKAFLDSIGIKEKFKPLDKNKIKKEVKKLIKVRRKEFYFAAVLIAIPFSLMTMTLDLLIIYILDEIYLFNLIEIAFTIGIAYILAGLFSMKVKKFDDSMKIILAATLLIILGTFLISLGKYFVFLGVALIGISTGIMLKHNELLILKFTEREDRALSTALLAVPSSFLSAAFFSTAGLFSESLGIYNFIYIISLVVFLCLSIGHFIYKKETS